MEQVLEASKIKYSVLQLLEDRDADHLSNMEETFKQTLDNKDAQSECIQEVENSDRGYAHSDSEVNTEKQRRRKYQRRRVAPSDRVTRSVAKKIASN